MRLQSPPATASRNWNRKVGHPQKACWRPCPADALEPALRIEQLTVIQVTSLQHATVNEALVKSPPTAVPDRRTPAESVPRPCPHQRRERPVQGEQVADFLVVAARSRMACRNGVETCTAASIAPTCCKVTYQTRCQTTPRETVCASASCRRNLQRGFVTVQAGAACKCASPLPVALQPTNGKASGACSNRTCRLPRPNSPIACEPSFSSPCSSNVTSTKLRPPASTTSPSPPHLRRRRMLTQVRLEMVPGDKRLLKLTLRKAQLLVCLRQSKRRLAWREQDRILIRSSSSCARRQAIRLRCSTAPVGATVTGPQLELVAPKFDLPLEKPNLQVRSGTSGA